ncbi:hypothetical protein [Flavobacterium sp. N1994]|uniref:hypothetical protein n=1 Tax=Flavobacterium sp. N1994 TaxID=2986827 RepID=UPI002221DFAB|nr:hypothetical protein [Flavobacterium sp. N1994]
MSVKVNQIDGETITVNGKTILFQSENWVAKTELTTQESEALQLHLNSINRKPEADDLG